MIPFADLTNPKPGVYHGITHQEYAALPYIRKSYLYKLAQCPAKARIVEPETQALLFGRAFHSLILDGEDTFKAEYAVIPKYDRRTKAGKALYEQAVNDNAGKTIINEEDAEKIYAMREAVLLHPSAKVLLSAGHSESTVIWKDQETGLLCKCRPDYSTYGNQATIVDIKKTRSAEPHAFQRDVVKFGYDLQAGMYLEGVSVVAGKKFDAFVFICVEDEPPYRIEVYALSDEFIARGRSEFHRLMRLEVECRTKNHWPNYKHPGIDSMEIPGYLTEKSGIYEAMPFGLPEDY